MTVHARAEGATPVPVEADQHALRTLWERADDPAEVLRAPTADGWQAMSWAALVGRVRTVAAGLVALGLQPGDRVALLSATRVEWTIADLAILAAGCVTVPIYETSSAAQCERILSDSQARLALAERGERIERIQEVRRQVPTLEVVEPLDGSGLDALAARGDADHQAEVEERVAALTGTDLAGIVYTSGTTGPPKGCELTHGNIVWTARQVAVAFTGTLGPGDSALLFLPLAHALPRLVQFLALETGIRLGYAKSRATLDEDLAAFQPTFLLGVPRVFEKLLETARSQTGGIGRRGFDLAVRTGQAWSAAEHPGPGLRVLHAAADRLVYRRLRAGLGGRVRYCVSGGARLDPSLARFFDAAGITILDGYGVTETTAPATVNTPGAQRIGTVGRPVPGVAIAISAEDEVLVNGPSVFRGYHDDPQATAAAHLETGTGTRWFRTGDLGELDADGFLRVTGRTKELIVTAGGKNVSPAELEARLQSAPLIAQSVVVGDGRPFVGALVVLDADQLATFARQHGAEGGTPAEWRDHEQVRAEVQRAVDHANEGVSRAESIRDFVILDRELSEADGELTPTMTLRRGVIAEHFADDIRRLYGDRTAP